MYNIILLNLISQLNPNDLMLLLINVIWVGYIIYSCTKENSITKKGKEILKSLKETIKKELIHVRNKLTQIKSFFNDICRNIFNNILNIIKRFQNIYQCLYYTIVKGIIQLFKCLIKPLKVNYILKNVVSSLEEQEKNNGKIKITTLLSCFGSGLAIIGSVYIIFDKIVLTMYKGSGNMLMEKIVDCFQLFMYLFVLLLIANSFVKIIEINSNDEDKKKLNKRMNTIRGVWLIVLITLCVTRCYIIDENYAVAEQKRQEQLKLEEQKRQEQLKLEEQQKQKELNNIYMKYSDYYLEFIKMDYNNIPKKVFDWDSHNFIIEKDDSSQLITFKLIDKKTHTIILTDTYKKDLN